MPISQRTNPPGSQTPSDLPARQERSAAQLVATALAAALLLAIPAGCATPASAERIVASASDAPPTASGAHGALSPEQAKKALAQLQARSPDAGIFERHLAIEEAVAESPLTVDNKATLLQDGAAAYAAMFAAMESARDHIFVEMYIIEDDETGNKFADAWIRKVKQGVPVTLMYDGVGSLNTPKEFFQRLRDGGVTVAEYNPVNPLKAKKSWDPNERDHRKLLVVDGRVAFVGGINISGVYSSGSIRSEKRVKKDTRPWRDTQVRIEGPAAFELQKTFLESWPKASDKTPAMKAKPAAVKPAGHDAVRTIVGQVAADQEDGVNPIYATFLSAILNAEKSVHITMAYFVPDAQTMQALEGAAKRGVDVTIVVPSFTDFWGVFYAGRSKYEQLLESGVKLYERKERLLHAKTAVVDGVWSTVGSANLDWRSFLHNQELNVVVLGPEFGDQMEAAFKRDIANSNAITRETWAERPIKDRTLEFAAQFWQYWL